MERLEEGFELSEAGEGSVMFCKWSGIITNLRIRISGWNLDMERISDLIFSPRGVCVGIIIPEISVSGGGLVIIDNGAEPGWTVAVR